MQQWEYRVWSCYEAGGAGLVQYIDGVEVAHDQRPPLVSSLAQVGADGWELVSTHSIAGGSVTYLFKRPKE